MINQSIHHISYQANSNLQDHQGKRQILCDKEMQVICNKLLGGHLWADEKVVKLKDPLAPLAYFLSITPGSSQVIFTSS
ncbi:hypothetical protein DFH28DRAFT_1131363 [Melampsora americana]|nr:hypothetical protein DFH28DRAFT_1131363 [Melampsora americana]